MFQVFLAGRKPRGGLAWSWFVQSSVAGLGPAMSAIELYMGQARTSRVEVPSSGSDVETSVPEEDPLASVTQNPQSKP